MISKFSCKCKLLQMIESVVRLIFRMNICLDNKVRCYIEQSIHVERLKLCHYSVAMRVRKIDSMVTWQVTRKLDHPFGYSLFPCH